MICKGITKRERRNENKLDEISEVPTQEFIE